MLTFEGEAVQGASNIVQKLVSMPFKKCRHEIIKKDFQPNPFNNGVIIFVTGNIYVDEEPNPLKFAQVSTFIELRCAFLHRSLGGLVQYSPIIAETLIKPACG